MRVLIVEDQAKLGKVLRGGLRKHGLVADVATRGEDALWMASSARYDVLLLDVMLPASTASRPVVACAPTECGRRS
jgi:DNA-binding response OmpR family regulator